MGMFPYAVQGYTISLDDLREILPEQVKAIEAGLEAGDESWGALAQEGEFPVYDDGGDVEVRRLIAAAVDALKGLSDAFNKATGGLGLRIDYYDTDMGSPADDVQHTDGCVFLVEDAVTLTPAAKRMGDKIKPSMWTGVG